jgi:hypothetical protein
MCKRQWNKFAYFNGIKLPQAEYGYTRLNNQKNMNFVGFENDNLLTTQKYIE